MYSTSTEMLAVTIRPDNRFVRLPGEVQSRGCAQIRTDQANLEDHFQSIEAPERTGCFDDNRSVVVGFDGLVAAGGRDMRLAPIPHYRKAFSEPGRSKA